MQPFFLDDEPHPLEERGRGRRRMFPQEDLDGRRNRVTQLALGTHGALAALRVFAVGQTVCRGGSKKAGSSIIRVSFEMLSPISELA